MKNTLHRQLRIGDIILSAKPFIFMCEGKTESDLGSRVKKSVHRGRNKTGEKIGEEQYPQCWASRVQLLALDSHGSFQPWCKLTRFHDKPLCYVLFFFPLHISCTLKAEKWVIFPRTVCHLGSEEIWVFRGKDEEKEKGKWWNIKQDLKMLERKNTVCLSVCWLRKWGNRG